MNQRSLFHSTFLRKMFESTPKYSNRLSFEILYPFAIMKSREVMIDEDVSWFRRRPTIAEDLTPQYILKTIDKKVILKVRLMVSIFSE